MNCDNSPSSVIGTENSISKKPADSREDRHDEEFSRRRRMESIIENIISGVIVIDEETHLIQDVNPAAEEIIGLPREKIIGQECHMFVCPAEKGKCPISDLGQTVNKSERILINSAGEKIPILKSVSSVLMEEGKCLIESFVDLRQIKETEKELIHSRIEAESANRAKSDFLATMSHELRTPLNSIIGFSDLILEGNTGELTPLQQRYLGNISVSGKHLLSLINNVLDLSKIEAGKLDLHLEGFSADEVFTEIEQLAVPLADKKEVIMNYSVDRNLKWIYADKIRFKQILYNLISNAIKFTPKNGRVDVTVEKADDVLKVSVKDTGIGISEDDMKKLFQPFTQIDSAANRRYEGTGLGLSLVKRFVELHNGKIMVESVEGAGTDFIFELPLREDSCRVRKTNMEEKSRTGIPASEIAKKIAENFTGEEKLILVVEDDDKSRELLEVTLLAEGYQVKGANNGKEALELARKLKPFMIMLDIMMSGMDGREVLRNLKSDDGTKDIPVIMLSMLDETENKIIWGAADSFIKPVSRKKLMSAIERIKNENEKRLLKILVADDEPAAVEVITQILAGMELELFTAYGGKEAIRVAEREHPDLIILDLMMPEVSGFDVIKALRKKPSTSDIPIAISTAKYLEKEDEEMLDGRILGVMHKGQLDKEKLMSYIKSLQ